MPILDPALLSEVSQSPYRQTIQQGYRNLRFDATLEGAFQAFHARISLKRLRWATGLAMSLIAMFALLDYLILSEDLAIWTVAIRLGLIFPSFCIVLWASFRVEWRSHLQSLISISAILTGIGVNGIQALSLVVHHAVPYEGILLVILFTAFIACLLWRYAVMVNLVTFATMLVVDRLAQTDAALRLYHAAYMFAALVIAIIGSYLLEYGARTTFLFTALLSELAERDSLTGLYNRRALNSHLDRLRKQGQREHTHLAVAMVDVDYFKRYNDYYGHAEGDRALQSVATAIGQQARRPLDLAARYGGEEFAIVWYRIDETELGRLGEQVRAAIRALNLPHQGSPLGDLSASVGIAFGQPSTEADVQTLLQHADVALYQAKENGRDQVALFAG